MDRAVAWLVKAHRVDGRWRVVDNGEGTYASPDQVRFTSVTDPAFRLAQPYCDDPLDFPALNDGVNGNIQVH